MLVARKVLLKAGQLAEMTASMMVECLAVQLVLKLVVFKKIIVFILQKHIYKSTRYYL
jgi:hypothetical protein